MAMSDDKIRELVHVAFDEVNLKEDASARMLQELRDYEQHVESGREQAPRRARIVPWALIPVAAALVLALVVGHNIRLGTRLHDNASFEASSAEASPDELDAGVTAELENAAVTADETAAADTSDAVVSEVAIDEADVTAEPTDIAALSFVADDGAQFELVLEGGAPVELDAGATSELIASGTAVTGDFKVYAVAKGLDLPAQSYVIETNGIYLLAHKV